MTVFGQPVIGNTTKIAHLSLSSQKKMSNVLFVFQDKCSFLIDFGAHAYIV